MSFGHVDWATADCAKLESTNAHAVDALHNVARRVGTVDAAELDVELVELAIIQVLLIIERRGLQGATGLDETAENLAVEVAQACSPERPPC